MWRALSGTTRQRKKRLPRRVPNSIAPSASSPITGRRCVCSALIDAGLGRKEEAIREGRRAAELTPITKDAVNGAHIMQFLGVIYAWTGEKDLAIKQIAATLQVPSLLSYGELRLHPFWDPLRGDPRFEKIVASLAPKTPDK